MFLQKIKMFLQTFTMFLNIYNTCRNICKIYTKNWNVFTNIYNVYTKIYSNIQIPIYRSIPNTDTNFPTNTNQSILILIILIPCISLQSQLGIY